MEVKTLPDISAIQPDRLVKYRVSEDKFSAEVLLPGLSYTDFDQKIGGKISLWSLVKMFEALTRQAKMSDLGFVPGPQHEKSTFVASQSMHFSKEIHNMRYAKLFGKKRPLKAHLYLSNVGGASLTIVTELFDSKTGQKLGRNVWVAVCIDMKSRKPIAVPEHISSTSAKNHLKSIETVTIRRPVLPVIPDNAFQYEMRGRHSDCDMNQHITQATYLRWCSDAGSMGALKGCFSQFKRHIELYPMKCAEYHFIGEARVNETVNVNVWEDGTRRKRTLFFAIQNKGRIIFIMNMEFYDGDPAKDVDIPRAGFGVVTVVLNYQWQPTFISQVLGLSSQSQPKISMIQQTRPQEDVVPPTCVPQVSGLSSHKQRTLEGECVMKI